MRPVFLSLLLLVAACNRDPLPRASATTPVFLISIDTLRSDRLPAYGYKAIETPHIDAFRRDAILYERAYSHCPLTVPSHASVLTGLLPSDTGLRDNTGYTMAAQVKTMAEILSAKGYATGAAVSAYVLRKGSGMERGFAFYDDDVGHERGGMSISTIQREGSATIGVAQKWIDSQTGKPLLFFLHLYEPHTPYEPPEPYRSRYGLYDGEVARSDELVGSFLNALKERGLYDRSLIILFSDHGEGLNDHGEEEHGIFLYREAIQVPLMVKLPGSAMAGRSVSAPVQLSDIFPTVMAQTATTEVAPRQGAGQAVSLLAQLDPKSPEREIYSETYFPRFHFGWSDLHSLIRGDHHFIQAPQPELYDLSRDPAEKQNVLAEQRRLYASLRQAIQPLIRGAEAPKPISAEEAAKLAALGYLGSAAPAEGPLPDPKTKTQTFREIRDAFKLFRAGQYAEALRFYEKLLQENPRMLDLWDITARAHMRLGHKERAIASAKEGLKLSPGSTHLALIIANQALDLGRHEEARQHAELAVSSHPGESHELLARIALAQGDTGSAQREAEKALQHRDENARAQIILARIAMQKEQFEQALQHLQKAAETLHANKATIAGFHQLYGDALARLGRMEEAERQLREEIRLFPEDPQAYKNLILLLTVAGRIEEATQLIFALEKASPTPPSYAAISETLRVIGDARGARYWAMRGLQRFPEDRTLRRLSG